MGPKSEGEKFQKYFKRKKFGQGSAYIIFFVDLGHVKTKS